VQERIENQNREVGSCQIVNFLARLDPNSKPHATWIRSNPDLLAKFVRSGYVTAFNLFEMFANLFFKMVFDSILLYFFHILKR
jgi:hypothetical protein